MQVMPNIENERFLLEKYTPLVRRIAFALRNMKPLLLDQDDAEQDGMIGLLRAIRSNRIDLNEAKFAAFARTSIRGAIIDGYRAAGNVSRRSYSQAKEVRRAVAEGTEVSAAESDVSARVMSQAWTPAIAVGDEVPGGPVLVDGYPGPEQRAISNQLLRLAVDALARTPIRERTIFIACELDEELQTKVAARYGLSPGRISQIITQVRANILHSLA